MIVPMSEKHVRELQKNGKAQQRIEKYTLHKLYEQGGKYELRFSLQRAQPIGGLAVNAFPVWEGKDGHRGLGRGVARVRLH
jgi:hypothetical protein